MSEISFNGVTKRYPDGALAVQDLHLTIDDGELMILVGPSGCGKSTALRMVAGLEEITDGELTIGGRVVNGLAPKSRDIAMVFQSYALYPHMTVAENMGFALKLAKLPKQEIGDRVAEAARILDLVEHLDRRPGSLSGGQRQRVAMGRAIVREPSAFLMDEPLSNLDAKLRVGMRAEIARLHARLRTTVLYVTHDQTEAMTLGDRVAVMRAGELQQVGTPAELYAAPVNAFVAGFMGSPPMNLVEGRVDGDLLRTGIGDIPLGERERRALADGDAARDVLVGLRPEAFQDAALGGVHSERQLRVKRRIDLVEALGAEVLGYFSAGRDGAGDDAPIVGDAQIVARLGAGSRVRVGEPAELVVDLTHMHLFDVESGRRLIAPAPALAAVSTPS